MGNPQERRAKLRAVDVFGKLGRRCLLESRGSSGETSQAAVLVCSLGDKKPAHSGGYSWEIGMIDSMTLRDSAGDVDGISSESFVSSAQKGHSALTKEQGLVLLSKLAKDDGFRARFEQHPAQALSEIGIPQQQIAGLREACLAPRKLAPANELEIARHRLSADLDASVLVFIIPTAKI